MSWAGLSAGHFVREAERLGPVVLAARGAIERERALPAELVRVMREAGFFSLWLPRSLGGPELTPAELAGVVEIFSRLDGSVGWLVGIGSSYSRLAGFLAAPVARAIWGDGSCVLAGTLNPVGTAVPVAGGYRVNGQWSYASGIDHSDWLVAGCRVIADGAPRVRADGSPETRLMLFPTAQAEVLDTWDVMGIRGSGSHDFRVAELHVPDEHSIDSVVPPPVEAGVLYRLPLGTVFNTSFFGVPLGIARAAIDDLVEMAQSKTAIGATQVMREEAGLQILVGRAEMILRSARALVFETVEALWEAGRSGEVTMRDRALARMAGSHAAASAVQVVDMMFAASGAGGIYERGRLARCWRDVHAMSHHAGISTFQLQTGGRVLMGMDAGTARL